MSGEVLEDVRAMSRRSVPADVGTVVYEREFKRSANAIEVERWTEAAGWVTAINRDTSAGIYAYHPPITELFSAAKRHMRTVAASHGFEEHIFPRHYSEEDLRAFGWLDDKDLGQELVAITPMHPDGERGSRRSLGDPVQCLGFYVTLVDLQRRSGGYLPDELFEAGAFCVYEDQGGWTVRNETRQRLQEGWSTAFEFGGAEFVFAGFPGQVYQKRWDVLCSVIDLLSAMTITHRVVAARPCFHTAASGPEDAPGRSMLYELATLDIQAFIPQYVGSRDPWIEIGGGDVAGDALVSAFGLRVSSGRPILSGCQGFGWQRFAFPVLSQLGTDPERWPEMLGQESGSPGRPSRLSSILRK